ncbi:hypothetical protein N7516_007125 [Penicillium verrucosum]|uniref:uncharacterized protein n=1 Tax=Penicillium verrucosum TaxID=60171 RepID=UPI00254548A2|nr:uncharacterized protein N7516_007125 [Penicillium verrucosum]KAJ5932636.1 hypothetical protein N7516_007125 [Penicillium verrucosum]
MSSLRTYPFPKVEAYVTMDVDEEWVHEIEIKLFPPSSPTPSPEPEQASPANDTSRAVVESPVSRPGRLSHIHLRITFPRSTDNPATDPSITSDSTGVKRKRDSSPEPEQASPANDTSCTFVESPLSRPVSPLSAMAPLIPMELPELKPITIPNSRVWETHRPSSFNFAIYEDPEGQETPNVSPVEESFNIDQDEENIFLTAPDSADSVVVEDTRPNFPGREASLGHADAFGLPLHREMSDFIRPVRPAINPVPERHMRRGREVFQTLWADETQVRGERNGRLRNATLTDTRAQRDEGLGDITRRGQNRRRSGRQPALRNNAPVQARPNIENVRRVLDFQQPQASRPVTPEGDGEPQLEQEDDQDQ